MLSPIQKFFVEGGQILDVALIPNKTNDFILKRNELCKLDLEKANDFLNRKFLISVLQKMEFGER